MFTVQYKLFYNLQLNSQTREAGQKKRNCTIMLAWHITGPWREIISFLSTDRSEVRVSSKAARLEVENVLVHVRDCKVVDFWQPFVILRHLLVEKNKIYIS